MGGKEEEEEEEGRWKIVISNKYRRNTREDNEHNRSLLYQRGKDLRPLMVRRSNSFCDKKFSTINTRSLRVAG
jgi:hypothetical protein